MKAKNKLAVFAGVLAACAALMPFEASAAGHIRRMDSTSSFPESAPARIGSEVTFSIVLDNSSVGGAFDTPWNLKYQGFGSEAFDAVNNPPMVAIKVSGETRYANLVRVGQYGSITQLTEMAFSYIVKPGDMAAPMLVVNDDVGGAFQFMNLGATDIWDIRDANGTRANLSFRGSGTAIEGVSYNNNYNLNAAADTIGMGPVYIKTLDFDSVTTANGYWREVAETTETASPSAPRILIPGGSATNGTVYVWISDETGTNVSTTLDFGSDMETQLNIYGQKVHPVTITTGDEFETFTLKGLSTNGTGEAYIYLSALPQNTFATGDYLISNFTYRVVKVTEAPEPYVWFTIDNASVVCPTNWEKHVATLSVHLSHPFSEDVVVNLNMMTATRSADTLFATNSIRVSDLSTGTGSWLNKDKQVIVRRNTTLGQAYIYALGAEEEDIRFTPSIASPADAAAYYREPKAGDGCLLKINASSPVLEILDSDVKAVTPPVFALVEKKPYTFHLLLADGYRCSKDTSAEDYPGYTIRWDRESDKAATAINPQTFTNIVPVTKDGKLVLPVSVTYPYAGSFSFTKIRVTNPDGGFAEIPAASDDPIVVNVGASMKAYARPDKYDPDSGETLPYGEGEQMKVSFSLSEPYVDLEGNSLYAFLEPLNEAASNTTDSAQWAIVGTNALGEAIYGTGGILIDSTTGKSVGTAIVNLKDGYSESVGYNTPRFGVRFCTSQTFDPTAEIDTYSISPIAVAVTNCLPWTVSINSGDDTVRDNGGRFETPIVVDVDTTFELVPGDKAPDFDIGGTDSNNCLVARWGFKGENDKKWTYVWKFYVGVNEYSNRCVHAFNEPGTTNNQVKVTLIDKDMRQPGDIYWVDDDTYEEGGYWKTKTSFDVDALPSFTAFVSVTDQPTVLVSPSLDYFSEQDFLDGNAYFTVSLSETADKPIDVTLYIGRMKDIPPGTENLGLMEVEEYTHTFPKGRGATGSATAWRADVSNLDGTALTKSGDTRFCIWAKVTSPATVKPNGSVIPYCDLYGSQTNFGFVVQNTAPVFDMSNTSVGGYDENTETNRYSVEKNVPIPVTWRVSDVLPDLTNKLVVTVRYGLVESNFTYTSESTFNAFQHTVDGSWSISFTDSGNYTVTVMATDKDNGREMHRWYFVVAASKNVFILPHVQDNAKTMSTTEAAPFIGAKASGVGSGRVWAGVGLDTGFLFNIANFKHQWVYKPAVGSATFYGLGYEAMDVEGSLTPNDQDIDSAGNRQTSTELDADHYKYLSRYDSFFYRWVFNKAAASGGGAWESSLQTPTPQYGKGKPVEGMVTLAEEEDDPTKSYADILVEAIFSKELYLADNMGDINGDGIPDYYAVAYPEAYGTGGENSSGGGTSTSSTTPTELINASAYNGDNDFLPAANRASDPFNPGRLGWGPGSDFTFRMEIRGFGNGLNEPGVSDFELTTAETMALFSDWTADGNVPTGVYADDYASATNWATRTGWTCERRLDPTDPDTDGDGFDDGTEYFFWYYSRIGLMQNGSWKRMTGSKFSTVSRLIGKGEEIPSWAIAARFDPRSATILVEGGSRTDVDATSVNMINARGETFAANTRDFDNDGLADLEELALGLNPVNWDSDGDGISDFYEIIHGLNPLDPIDGDRTLSAVDYRNNPDRDFMAWMQSERPFDIVELSQEGSSAKIFCAVDPKQFIFQMAPKGDPEDRIRVTTVSSEQYFVVEADLVTMKGEDDKMYLAAPTPASRVFEYDGTVYLGEDVVLPEGTGINEVSADAESVSHARIAATTPLTIEAAAQLSAFDPHPAIAVEAFRYGNDSGPLVPVPLNGTDLSKVDTDLTVSSFTSANLVYIHNQVFNVAGFDPRTGWSKNEAGYVAARWEKEEGTSEGEASQIDYSGYSINTAPYTSLDEYLVLQYRSVVTGANFRAATIIVNGSTYDSYDDMAAAYLGNNFDTRAFILGGTTYPNKPFEAGDGLIGTNQTGEASIMHGADTDSDGIPDGWELYVNINPNDGSDASSKDEWAKDGDELTFLEEYASTDSTAMYSNHVVRATINSGHDGVEYEVFPECTTIFQNHPSQPPELSGKLHNWYNKFFPTNPYDSDTDGDGVFDSAEGASWKGWFYVGRNEYKVDFNFIYGEPSDDGKSKCIKGAGLNPCTVDTDGDIIPDAWEYEFAGITVSPDGTSQVGGLDYVRITAGDGLQEAYSNKVVEIRGGMDGTVEDANYDFDRDGLLNYQEYLVQSLRHLRYDDAETPLMGRMLVWDNMKLAEGPFVKFLPMLKTSGEAFYQQCLDAGFTGGSAFKFRELGYFVPPAHAWDMLNFKDGGYLFMFGPKGLSSSATPVVEKRVIWTTAKKGYFGGFEKDDTCAYASTDPRQWDSDNDGMDDYYELFHGLNPLLGSVADPAVQDGETIHPNARKYDRIASIYLGEISAWKNAWVGWDNVNQPPFDAMRFPWMMGTAECDADGDGLRNVEEALLVNVTSPTPTHTDPSPLWMTDSSSTNFSSYVSQYYRMPFYTIKWNHNWVFGSVGSAGQNKTFIFTFEENDGYDTDHDFIPDNYELTKNVSPASDPLDATDPTRRQGLWFSGNNSAAVSTLGTQQRANSIAYDLLRQFTVEVWVKAEEPEARREQVILERAANYSGSSLSNAAAIVRANFRLGVNEGGFFFGEFEGSTANSGVATLIGPKATTNWTHLALSFDGSHFALYVNGNPNPVAQSFDVGLIPANGILIMEQEAGPADDFVEGATVFPVKEGGYQSLPCATVLGARALDGLAFALDNKPTWDSYGSFFKGWVAEVRVWDGARTANEINANYARALTRDEIIEARNDIFNAWNLGRRRNDKVGTGVLPAELLQHYNFSTLPGAVDVADVAVEPNAFTQNVTDQVRVEGASVPDGIVCGWWASAPVRSTVYNNYNLVPWIANTVAHLPPLDGSAIDSQYWSKEYAGVIHVDEASTGVADGTNEVAGASYYKYFDFPNTANPYPYYIYWNDRSYHLNRLGAMDAASSYMAYLFYLRANFVGTSDLVPLGDAFAKRSPDHWDGNGAMDAWELTVVDSDADGLPDWWEALYAGVGENPAVLSWDSLVDYWGIGKANVPAWEAYQRDLASGMLPGGAIDSAYVAIADLNQNGMFDYWERMYGVNDASDDADFDGLSNLAEYLSSEGTYPYGVTNGFWRIDPMRSVTALDETAQVVPDYFLPGPTNKVLIGPDAHGKDRYFDNWSYLGEIFSDHDFMEDWWERGYHKLFFGDRVYDPAKDYDDDGWSNWSECRYSFWSGFYQADIVDTWLDKTGDIYVKCYPRPAIGVRVSYKGKQDVAGRSIVIRTATPKSQRIDATYFVPGAIYNDQARNPQSIGDYSQLYAAGSNDVLTAFVEMLYLGRYVDKATLHGFLNPGSLMIGSGTFWKAPLNSENQLTWRYRVGTKIARKSGTLAEYNAFRVTHADATLEVGNLSFTQFAITIANDDEKTGKIIHMSTSKKIGEINYRSGEFSIDMEAFALSETDTSTLSSTVFAAQYEYQIGLSWPQTIYISDGVFVDPAARQPHNIGYLDGFVKEGKNTIEVFIDLNNNGVYDAGEPMGVAKNVDVSWHKTRLIDIEVTDTSPVLPRYNVDSGTSDRMAVNGIYGGVMSAAEESDDFGQSAGSESAGSEESGVSQISKTIRIVRKAINGEPSQNRVLMSKDFILDDRAYIHEGDVLTEDRFDLDWKWLVRDAAKLGIAPEAINTVTYSIEDSGTTVEGVVTNTTLATFVNSYTTSRPVGTPVSPTSYAPVYSAAPTFAWAASDETASAFRIQIRAKDAEKAFYDSGYRRMPGRTGMIDGTSGYQFTAPLYVDMPLTNGIENVLLDGSNYQWRVALFNAKYRSEDESVWSDWAGFQMDVRNRNRYPQTRTGYGVAAAVVRYYGPDRDPERFDRIDGKVIVEAFESADFSGQPLARIRMDHADGLLDSITDNHSVNATLRGVEPGKVYLRAFIDANNNGKKDSWESWGYANHVGLNTPYLYTPKDVTVPDSLVRTSGATAIIYIEDTDVNQNEVPDCIEFDGTGSDVFVSGGDRDGDGLTDDEEEDSETIATKWDTDGDGMPDGWEVKFADTDPGSLDGDEFVDGDMMAYEEFGAWLVTLNDADESRYLVLPKANVLYSPRVNDAARSYTLASWYAYGADRGYPSLYGLGTNVAVSADVYITNVETVRAVRVHAQVYAEHGFEKGVATAFDTVGRSKPFTALDKYLVCRYLEALGMADENMMNTNGVSYTADTAGNSPWADWTLLPNTADGNRDGIPDGWQLYVMFGQTGTDLANAAGAIVTPWTDPAKAREISPSGGISWRDEYDMRVADVKYLPTDPWTADSDADGISDADAYNYHLKEGNLRGDDDNDQLPNFIEFLVTRGFASNSLFPTVYADRRISASPAWGGNQFVPDYFLRVGSLYLGEMFSDHDFMEAYLETSNEVQNLIGPLDSFKYDSHLDADGDGWSNFSEMRAFVDGGTKMVDYGLITNAVSKSGLTEAEALALTQDLENRGLSYDNGDYFLWSVGNHYAVTYNEVTNDIREVAAYSGKPVPTVTVKIGYGGRQSISNYTVKAWAGTGTTGMPKAMWTGRTLENGKLVLAEPDSGSLVEGQYTFVVFGEIASTASSDSESTGAADATWTPGAPYGVATGVEVGWKQASFSIGLTDVNPSMMRCDLAKMIAANTAAAQASLNDRGVNGNLNYPNMATAFPGEHMPSVLSGVRVRIVRNDINSIWRRYDNGNFIYASEMVYHNILNLDTNPTFAEDALLLNGAGLPSWDLDWGNLGTAASNMGLSYADIVKVGYVIVIGDGTYGPTTTNNNIATVFYNSFELGSAQTKTYPLSPYNESLTDPQPTFQWTHNNGIKQYPAFQLRVFRADSGALVYDSGIRRAPPRDASGVYTWTPEDLHVGEPVRSGHMVFWNEVQHYWTVSMLDAKFTTPNSNEERRYFTPRVTGGVFSDRGAIEIAVKYFGPVTATIDTSSLANLVRVEAFSSPDFSGSPAAVTYARNVDTMADSNQVTYNARIIGLPAGEWYLRAYIDSNGNRKLDVGESWGYGCYMGTDRKDVWTPRPYTFVPGNTKMPEAVVYIEDADTDNNGLPDAYSASFTPSTTPYSIIVDNGVASAINVYVNLDSGTFSLPYVSMLTHFSDEGEISAPQLGYAMAMAGLPADHPLFNLVVRITSFSVEKGIDIAVDVPTSISEGTLKATRIGAIDIPVTVRLWHADSLDGTWTEIGSFPETFSMYTVNGKPEKWKLDPLNVKLKEKMSGQSGFFKVTVE